jgi:replicative DNA helicase
MIEEQNSLADFGKSFQDNLVKSIILDKDFCSKMIEVLEIRHLEQKPHQIIVQKVFDYINKYNKHPSVSDVKTIVKTDLGEVSDVLREEVKKFFVDNFSKDSKVEDTTYVKDKSLEFCKKQRLYIAMEQSIELLNKSSFDAISKKINDALKLGESHNIGYDYLKDFEDRYKLIHRSPVSTGWAELDKICQGGLGKGELGVVIAPTGGGKSMLLTYLGAQAVRNGEHVVHYTLELSDTHVGNRYDSCLTGLPLKDLMSCKDAIYETVCGLSGSLLIKEYPTKTASTRTIRNHLDKIKQQGRNVNLIIVDYGDLLLPLTTYKEKRDNLGSIYEELRAIAQEYQCPIWTASQTNRTGLNAEVITMESISEAFNKCFVADFIFSLSRTIDDKNTNTGRIFIAKNRNGPDGFVFPIFMDTSCVKINIIKNESGVVEKPDFKTPEEKLKEKYRKTLTNK